MESYFLCSQEVVDHFKDAKKSKPFKSGYDWDKTNNYYVAVLDFHECEKHYNKIEHMDNQFSLWECVQGTMDHNKIKITNAKKNGLFKEIGNILDLSAERNLAMIVRNFADQYDLDPIEFINKKIAL